MDCLNQGNIDKIVYGMYKNNSYYGYKSSILKSGICKYYRRKIFDKFEWCVIEMMIFGIKDKGLLTNVINRIKILIMEEVVYNQLGYIVNCIELLNTFENQSLENKMCKMLEIISILKQLKRGRANSYINNWWKYHPQEYNMEIIKLDKINKYKGKKDELTLLKYGELFIEFLENKDERIIDIFNKIYSLKCECETRYRRKEPIYLIFKIIEDKYQDPVFKSVFEFSKSMFYKKNMIERVAFGIWIIVMILNYEKLNLESEFIKTKWSEDMLCEYFKNRKKITINEDFVIKDYHVNKKHGIGKFALVGSRVIDEDLSVLGENGDKYKEYYIKKKLQSNSIKIKKDILNIEIIPWCDFKDIKVLQKGVCGLKVCCIKVIYKNKPYILKEMRPSFNEGRDYMFIDQFKSKFKINSLNMKRIKTTKYLERIDRAKRTLVDNWKFETKTTVYCMMDYFDNIGDIGKHKHLLEEPAVFKECLKIRLYDGLFRSSDNILRNILVNSEGVLMSIDENDIYGKRMKIFEKSDWFKRPENIENTKNTVEIILDEWNINCDTINKIKNKMIQFKFSEKVEEMEKRLNNYKKIVFDEL